MDDTIRRLAKLTSEILVEIEHCDYERILLFIEQRDQVIIELKSKEIVLDSKEREMLKMILDADDPLVNKMNQLRIQASKNLDKLRKGKQQYISYEMQYSSDAAFYDRRK